eukprot:2257535-Amphidinium_carterae.1
MHASKRVLFEERLSPIIALERATCGITDRAKQVMDQKVQNSFGVELSLSKVLLAFHKSGQIKHEVVFAAVSCGDDGRALEHAAASLRPLECNLITREQVALLVSFYPQSYLHFFSHGHTHTCTKRCRI